MAHIEKALCLHGTSFRLRWKNEKNIRRCVTFQTYEKALAYASQNNLKISCIGEYEEINYIDELIKDVEVLKMQVELLMKIVTERN